ncbi:unnamed protein product, partial [Ectocarpus sp. 4 AP-2014]
MPGAQLPSSARFGRILRGVVRRGGGGRGRGMPAFLPPLIRRKNRSPLRSKRATIVLSTEIVHRTTDYSRNITLPSKAAQSPRPTAEMRTVPFSQVTKYSRLVEDLIIVGVQEATPRLLSPAAVTVPAGAGSPSSGRRGAVLLYPVSCSI